MPDPAVNLAAVNQKRTQQIFLIALGLGALGICLVIAQPFLGALVAAMALAILFYPVHARLLRRLRNANLAATMSLLLVTVAVLVPALLLGTAIIREAQDMYQVMAVKSAAGGGWTEWSASALHRVVSLVGVRSEETEGQIRGVILQRLRALDVVLIDAGQALITNIVSLVITTAVTLFALFFLFRDGHRLKHQLEHLVPLDNSVARRLLGDIGQSVVANFYGIGAVALAQGGLTGLIFFALGVSSPVLWGAAAGLFSMIPILGPAIIWLPAALVLGLNGSWGKAAILTAFGVGVVGLADNFIRPYVISGRVNLHPLLVFVALLGGAQAFGCLGLFIGPAALSLAVAVFELLRPEAE